MLVELRHRCFDIGAERGCEHGVADALKAFHKSVAIFIYAGVIDYLFGAQPTTQ